MVVYVAIGAPAPYRPASMEDLTTRQILCLPMAVDLAALVDPATTAVVTSEIQNGVIGEESALPALAEAAGQGMIPAVARLVAGARAAGVQVVHATAYQRADLKGLNTNARLFLGVQRSPVRLLPGTPAVEVIPEVGVDPDDIVLTRTHGLNPMAGTDLDPILRNLGIGTVVVAGVSVNVAITNLVMDAVNLGYQVVLPRDAVCGLPAAYADAVIDNTLALLATLTTVDELTATWETP
jgi:nicotinamidase-related amidase